MQQVFEHLSGIDQTIDDNLVGWSASRISKVARAVLRLAVYEILFSDVPDGVAINEAVEITKKYSAQDEASYVNGVLGTIEQGLLGTPIDNIEAPINALRLVHGYDPCIACAVHIVEPKTGRTFETHTSPWGGR